MKDVRYKSRLVFLVCFFLVIFISAMGSALAGKKVTYRLKWIKDIMSGGPIVAAEKGFFKNRGLEVEVLAGGFDLDPIKLVASGSDTFGVTGADTLLMARSKGIPIVAIGMEYQKTPVVFISKNQSGIRRPQDFIGRKVGVKFGTDAETVYMALLAKTGIDRKKITEVPLKWDMTPFFTGQVEVLPGWIINQPLVARNKGLEINVIEVDDYGINFYGNTYFTSEKTLKERPDLVKNFMAGVVDGWFYVFRHKDESIEICMKHGNKLDKKHQVEEYDAMLPLFVSENGRFCWMTDQRWQETHDTLLNLGLLTKPLDLKKAYSMEALVNTYK